MNQAVTEHNKRTVLVVDSESDWRDRVLNWLCVNFEVFVASTYSEALDIISQKDLHLDILITEISLNEGDRYNQDGLNLANQIKEIGRGIQTVILTRYATVSITRTVLKEKVALDLIEKTPTNGSQFNEKYFLEIVNEAINMSKSLKVDVFVLMPFADTYKPFYEDVIKSTIERMGLVCRRVDDFFGSRQIMEDILACIKDSRFILADFSGRSANVFFEVGIAHALGKSVLLLTCDLNDVPPKLRTVRHVVYESSVAGAEKITPMLESAVHEIRKMGYPHFFKHKDFELFPGQYLALMPSNEIGKQTYKYLVQWVMENNNCKGDRAEEIFNPVSVLNETWIRINSAEIIIADLSFRDADVFYLAGLAYGLGKKMIYIAQNEKDVPFDLQERSCLIYSLSSYKDGLSARQKLTQLVKDILS